jgi:putative ABC transport system ATP-binding protein
MIQLHKIKKDYGMNSGSVRVLQDVDLTIREGEFVALTGPSGCGKTTLFNIIGGLDHPDQGSYLLQGTEMTRLPGSRLAEIRNRHFGFVFQAFHLVPGLTALQNVALPLGYRGIGARQRRREAERALERAGIGHRANHRPAEMSGGEQQRVAIARALVGDPAILLADEPTGNLDTESGKRVFQLLEAIHQGGKTVLMITHNPELAARCDREIALRDGRIVSRTETVRSA